MKGESRRKSQENSIGEAARYLEKVDAEALVAQGNDRCGSKTSKSAMGIFSWKKMKDNNSKMHCYKEEEIMRLLSINQSLNQSINHSIN